MLGRELVLPDRKINSLEELFETFSETKDLFIYAAEGNSQKTKKLRKTEEKPLRLRVLPG